MTLEQIEARLVALLEMRRGGIEEERRRMTAIYDLTLLRARVKGQIG